MRNLLFIVWIIMYTLSCASSVYFGVIKENYLQGIYYVIWALLLCIVGYVGLKDLNK